MNSARSNKPFTNPLIIALSALSLSISAGMQAQEAADDSTISYSADFFDQYEPFSVNDMLDRIPGISTARSGGGNSGGPGSSGGSNRRGLGLGGDQIMINGRRITGKENEGNSQLSRIPANQVQYIEIIRGTSGDLDVRGGNQVINIVLLEAESRNSIAWELNADHLHDGEIKPGAKVSLTGQRGAFDYLLSIDTEPRWEYRRGFEYSFLTDGSPNDTVKRDQFTDSQPMTFSANLGYEFGANDIVHFNAQYNDSSAPGEEERAITDLLVSPAAVTFENDHINHDNDFWEIGGDYEHTFANGNRWKSLFIINEKEDDRLRERFDVIGSSEVKDLFLSTFNRYQEQIFRSSYSFDFSREQSLEFGIERAQTTLDSALQLGLNFGAAGDPAVFGGLTPITDSDATVEEIRYEAFAVHNWQINSRMSLESTLIIENSEIKQSGDVSKSRDFDFVRPKVDYRFDITPALQFRATVEKDVAQLSFNDFTANINTGDDDQDAIAGNPELRQEQSWRYDLNLEYRFNEGNGVVSSNVFYHDLEDVIDKVNVSPLGSIASANGNIGDGERYGIKLDGSLRMGMINLPELLITSSVQVEDSSVTDPFLGIDRRLNRHGRGRYSLGFRHDLTARNINYGLNVNGSIKGNMKVYDIDKIEDYQSDAFIMAFVETQAWGGFTFRFEATNFQESWRCRVRSRYTGGTLATGSFNEVEDSCSHAGEKYAIKVRGTF
jgi:outer membrane receptor protein involved in Fe transport